MISAISASWSPVLGRKDISRGLVTPAAVHLEAEILLIDRLARMGCFWYSNKGLLHKRLFTVEEGERVGVSLEGTITDRDQELTYDGGADSVLRTCGPPRCQ
jgi:hypothetical protein